MDKIIERFAFNFLIAQVLPASVLIVLVRFLMSFGPGGSLQLACSETIRWLMTDAHALAVFLASVPLGILLWALQITSVANRESFRKTFLNKQNQWVDKPASDIRPRTKVRKLLSNYWTNAPVVAIVLGSPAVLSFDLLSILMSKTRDLYKSLTIIRGPKIDNEVYLTVINDFNFSSSYFGSMAISFLVGAIWSACAAITTGNFSARLLFVVFYLLSGLHYLLGRLLRTAFDRSVDPAA